MIRVIRKNANHANHMIRMIRVFANHANHMIRMIRIFANLANHMIRMIRIFANLANHMIRICESCDSCEYMQIIYDSHLIRKCESHYVHVIRKKKIMRII